jgi:hypothetical protein
MTARTHCSMACDRLTSAMAAAAAAAAAEMILKHAARPGSWVPPFAG